MNDNINEITNNINSMKEYTSDNTTTLSIHGEALDRIINAVSCEIPEKSSKSDHQTNQSLAHSVDVLNFNSNRNNINNSNSYVISNKRELYLSKFDRRTTTSDILSYIKNKGIDDMENIRIFKLVKKNIDISTYSYVTFKIETTIDISEALLEDHFWPVSCTIKNFISKNSSFVTLDNFLYNQREEISTK